MADDSGEDLVSNVKVTGVDEATAKLEAYGDKGAAAFDKVNTAAAAHAAGVAKSSKVVEQGAKDTSDALGKVNESIKPNGPSQKALNQLADEASNLSRSAVKTSRDLAQFATRVAAIAAAGAAAIAGIAKLGAGIAAQVNQTTSAFDQNNQAQQRSVAQNLTATQAAIQYANQQQQLNRQLASGAIDYDTYSATLKANQQAYRDQIRVTAQLQAAEESARVETERLQKAAADRKAYDDLIATFGGPLTSSLIQLGNAAIAAKNQFIQSFGPGAAAFVDTLTQTLSSNGQAIGNFFAQASSKIQDFVSKNGPQIQKALESIGTAAGAIFNGVISAAPQLLSIFNNQVVPAFKALASAADSVTSAFNFLFGTNLSTGAVVIIAALGSMTGAFKSLLAVSGLLVQGFTLASNTLGLLGVAISPLGVAVLALAAAFIVLNTDWTAFGQNLLVIWGAVEKAFAGAGETIAAPFAAAWAAILGGWTATTDGIISAWDTAVSFFSGLPDSVGAIFTAIGTAIQSAFSAAFDSLLAIVQGWVAKVQAFLKPVVDLIASIGAALSGSTPGNSSDGSTPGFAGGGKVSGPGTSTSDSILAWLSDNEFVMRAKAVRKYGLSFMRAVNSGTLDLSKLAGFAAGGLVSALSSAAPAMGSLDSLAIAGKGSPWGVLNLRIGDQEFNNLSVPDQATGSALVRYATSGGRKPSWTQKNKR